MPILLFSQGPNVSDQQVDFLFGDLLAKSGHLPFAVHD